MATIQDFYKKSLSALRFQVDDDDLISFLNPEGRATPTVVDGRRLVLPTKQRLREGFGEDLQPFHPLSENIARRSASPVIKNMQRTAKAVLAHYFTELSLRLLAVASDPSLHKDLPPACSEYLKKVSNADAKTLKDFDTLIGKAVQKNKLITLYLRNGGTVDGKKMNRLCVIRFPIMDELNEEKPFGIKLRKKDRATLQALFHHIMPFGDSPEEYSAGSNSRIAPFFDAFMRAYAKVAEQLNSVVRKYAKPMEISLEPIDLSYLEELDNLGQYYEKIPSLRGNDGGTKEDTPEEAEATKAPTEKPIKSETVQARTPGKSTPLPPAEKPSSGMSVDDFMKTINPQQAQPAQPQNPYQAAPPPNPYATPGPVAPYGQPNQPMGGYGGYGGGYGGGGYGDPRRPGWLTGGQPNQPSQPVNPFAQALAGGAQAQPSGYGNQPYPPMGGGSSL